MYDDLVKWKAQNDINLKEGKPPAKIPESVGRAITLTAHRIGSRPNFRGYTYCDEMIQDGILDAIKAVKTFDPNQVKKNPFGYFSLIIWRAFLRRIADEKKEHKAKIDSMFDPNNPAFDTLDHEIGQFDIGREDLSDFYYEGKTL